MYNKLINAGVLVTTKFSKGYCNDSDTVGEILLNIMSLSNGEKIANPISSWDISLWWLISQ